MSIKVLDYAKGPLSAVLAIVGVGSGCDGTFTTLRDTDPPGAPVSERLRLFRAPQGTYESGGVAEYTVVGQPGAVEPSTEVLILALSGAEIGRGVSRPDGGLDPIPVSAIDAPSVVVIASDAEGNRSESVEVGAGTWVASFAGFVPGGPLSLGGFSDDDEGKGQRPTPLDAAMLRADSVAGIRLAASPEWRNVTRVSAVPPARSAHSIAYDTHRARIVLFGGFFTDSAGGRRLGDTWEWDGTRWTQAITASPGPRAFAMMAYDSWRGHTVVFGGGQPGGASNDMWTWDGDRWARIDPAGSWPAARFNGVMVFDTRRGRLVLFGGVQGAGRDRLADLWEWDGQRWTERSGADRPTAINDFDMAYDPARGRVVLFGGTANDSSILDEVWEWDGSPVDPTPAIARTGMAAQALRARPGLRSATGWSGRHRWWRCPTPWDGFVRRHLVVEWRSVDGARPIAVHADPYGRRL